MGIVKEFILYTSGLVLTVALIFIGFEIYGKTAKLGKAITDRETREIEAYTEYELYRYDGTSTKGNNIISYIRTAYGLCDAGINVSTDKGTFAVCEDTIGKLRSTDSVYYINPMREYFVQVNTDDNGSVESIDISQQ